MVLVKRIKQILLVFVIGFLGTEANAISLTVLEKRINKVVVKDLGLVEFEHTPIDITDEQLKTAEVGLNSKQIFKLVDKNSFNGFYIIETAMGRFHDFTYVVFFGTDLRIQLVRVIDYGGEHGAEITHKRWLRQFVGKSPNDNLMFKKNIDAISGATISGKSITESINNMLQKVSKLREKKFI